ncbi:DUF2332 domain-containing protein [Streptacidiphilus sp. P02-A3a]|uniref:DUF2332 domain-containing protein n=1 Tax=Streptacidiphilus sp. P02-A3a TaxID=2704468 RepID=UPI001CDD0A07|nr:DUF2332 domain-containing protein [Streptacidiphilus sp. P02-A3a]
MTDVASRERAAAMVEWQARGCAGSPLYVALLLRVAEDVRAGGPCADAIAGYENAPGPDAIALRLVGGVHALVLSGRAPGLAAYYPSAGGEYHPGVADACWSAFRDLVAAELPWVRDWMTRPPQTNEVGRSSLLLAGLLHATSAGAVPIRLFELGSSAGLNLRPDRFHYSADGGFAWGPADSPVRLTDTWTGGAPEWLAKAAAARPELAVVERRGCDPSPIDPASAAGELALRAYIWPDQPERQERLRGALRLAAELPATVQRLGAAEFLAGVELRPGTLTVVWHSVMRQYVPAAEWAQVSVELDRLAAASTPEAGFAHIAFEPERTAEGKFAFRLSVTGGPDGERKLLAEGRGHGIPAEAL